MVLFFQMFMLGTYCCLLVVKNAPCFLIKVVEEKGALSV